jgi:hypothetical protein
MTNRETDGDIHGECAAESEPSELSAFEKWWAMLSKVPYMSKKEIADRAFYAGEMASYELRFDACRPYLKEGETPAECLARNRADIVRLMGKWGAEKMRSAKLRDDLDKIAQTTGSDDPCRPRLKEGESPAEGLARFRSKITDIFGRWTLFMDAQKAALTEGGKMISSDRYKQIMAGLGMPNSQSLLCALQQVANEVGQKYSADAIALADAADRACARASISDLNWQRVSHDKESLQDQLDDCRPYLKDGETAADALRRLSNNNSSVLSWNGHNIYGDVDSLRDARDAIEYKAARIADSAAKLWPDEGIT